MSEDYSLVRRGKSKLFLVGCTDQVNIFGGGHVDSTLPESVCDGVGYVFVKMKPDHSEHPCLGVGLEKMRSERQVSFVERIARLLGFAVQFRRGGRGSTRERHVRR